MFLPFRQFLNLAKTARDQGRNPDFFRSSVDGRRGGSGIGVDAIWVEDSIKEAARSGLLNGRDNDLIEAM